MEEFNTAADFMNLLSDEESTYKSYKLQIPTKCTTPRKGLLQLNTTGKPSHVILEQHCLPLISIPAELKRKLVTKGDAQRPHLLTRFPVLMPIRPMEELKEQMDGMSCLDLHENIHNLHLRDYFTRHTPQTPTTFTRLTPFHSHTPQTPLPSITVERLTHTNATGPMDISITVTTRCTNDNSIPATTWARTSNLPNMNHKIIGLPSNSASITRGCVVRPQSTTQKPANNRYQTIAPLSLNAIVTHQRKPITTNTHISGRRVILT